MRARIMWCGLVVVVWLTLVLTPPTRTFALTNLGIQLAIFVPLASVPGWRKNWMSYVDFTWPAGLAAIGVQLVFFAQRLSLLTIGTAVFYSIGGLRMAVWGAHIYKPGWLKAELPRYQYQRRRWERAGLRSERLSVQYEILVQLMANASFLALPAHLIATNESCAVGPWEITAMGLWIGAYGFESLADWQKRRYLGGYSATGSGVCDVGLWRYTRHPNYFGQWIQWVALVALAIPSARSLYGHISVASWVVLSLALFWVVRMMYSTMVHYTGAVPAEYYSKLKRPAYADYQATVNRFFPGPRKRRSARRANPLP